MDGHWVLIVEVQDADLQHPPRRVRSDQHREPLTHVETAYGAPPGVGDVGISHAMLASRFSNPHTQTIYLVWMCGACSRAPGTRELHWFHPRQSTDQALDRTPDEGEAHAFLLQSYFEDHDEIGPYLNDRGLVIVYEPGGVDIRPVNDVRPDRWIR